jgi:sterol desaturase/sphingolipid hydroxylase (fatty acid hydroxylase superfamily)
MLVMLSVFVSLQDWMGALLRGPASVTAAVATLPRVVQAVLVMVLGDFGLYWGHRLSHRVPLLWRFHGVHHTAQRLDWMAAYREHPLDGIYSQLFLMTPCMFLGVSPYTIMPVLVFRGLWAVLVHSNTRLPLGPLGTLFGDPVLHRWHHARRSTADNYANLAPYLDILFGTHHRPADEDYPLGVVGSFPESFLPQLLPGFSPLARWVRGVAPSSTAGPRTANTGQPQMKVASRPGESSHQREDRPCERH